MLVIFLYSGRFSTCYDTAVFSAKRIEIFLRTIVEKWFVTQDLEHTFLDLLLEELHFFYFINYLGLVQTVNHKLRQAIYIYYFPKACLTSIMTYNCVE